MSILQQRKNKKIQQLQSHCSFRYGFLKKTMCVSVLDHDMKFKIGTSSNFQAMSHFFLDIRSLNKQKKNP